MTVRLALSDAEFRILTLHIGHPNRRLQRWLLDDDDLGTVAVSLAMKVTEAALTLSRRNLADLEGDDFTEAALQLGSDRARFDQVHAAIAEERKR